VASCSRGADIPCIRAPPVKNALRPILRQLNNAPVAMKLDQPPAIDELQQTGAAGTVERTMAAAAEQGHVPEN